MALLLLQLVDLLLCLQQHCLVSLQHLVTLMCPVHHLLPDLVKCVIDSVMASKDIHISLCRDECGTYALTSVRCAMGQVPIG